LTPNSAPVTPIFSQASGIATTPRSSFSSFHYFDSFLPDKDANGMTLQQPLRGKLLKARIECPKQSGKWVLPQCKQDQLITTGAIWREIEANLSSFDDDASREYVRRIHIYGPKLFGVLVCVNKQEDIFAFLDNGVTDASLPFRRCIVDEQDGDQPQYCLEGKDGNPIKQMDEWEDEDREGFERHQRSMTAPIFEKGMHYVFDENVYLPFYNSGKDIKGPRPGGYGEVLIRGMPHACHHNFWQVLKDDECCSKALKGIVSDCSYTGSS
jgi:hypothetical protein